MAKYLNKLIDEILKKNLNLTAFRKLERKYIQHPNKKRLIFDLFKVSTV